MSTQTRDDSMLVVEGLTKQYRAAQERALDSVSFAVPSGALVALLGPNGSGRRRLKQFYDRVDIDPGNTNRRLV